MDKKPVNILSTFIGGVAYYSRLVKDAVVGSCDCRNEVGKNAVYHADYRQSLQLGHGWH